MSFVARVTMAFAVMCMVWYVVVVGFAMDDVAITKALSDNDIPTSDQAMIPDSGTATANTTTAGEFSVSSVKDISFIKRFWIAVSGMPWWFNLFIGLFNGFILLMLTILWIVKVVHGNG